MFPRGFEIGPVKVAPATVLAPMAGVTDTVFRRLIRSQGGCGLIMTEFTSSHGVVAASARAANQAARDGGAISGEWRGAARIANREKPHRAFRYLYFEVDEHPIAAQLFGSDPHVMADAARYCQDLGFATVDINFGCPV